MSRSDEERVADIVDAVAELALVTAVGREPFLRSALHIRAAERLLEIIGEASNALSDELHAERRHPLRRRNGHAPSDLE